MGQIHFWTIHELWIMRYACANELLPIYTELTQLSIYNKMN